MRSIYADYNATTPLDADVRRSVVEALDGAWANPSSIHHLGQRARALLDDAREQVAAVFQCRPGEIVLTSGGTEANNLAILGVARSLRRQGKGDHLVCSPLEHPAVLRCHEHLARTEGFALTLLPVGADGVVDPDAVARALRPETLLVSVMAANNETGVLQPAAEIGRRCRERGVLFHVDAVQWLGKLPWAGMQSLNADLVAVCGHKLHGPKGAGALFVRAPLPLEPLLLGGAQEHDRRGGTENLPAIVGFAEAVRRFVPVPVFDAERLGAWSRRLASVVQSIPGVRVWGGAVPRLCNTLAFTVEDTDSLALLANLDLEGVCASSGSACSAGSVEPSHVLRAMGASPEEAAALVRVSLGRENTETEIDRLASILPMAIARARQR